MKRYFHLQILASMLCLATCALRHQRHLLGTPWTGGIAEAATEGPWSRGDEMMRPTEPAVRYEEHVLAEAPPIEQPNKGHLFAWNDDDPTFYDEKGAQKPKTMKRHLGLTPWRYFQRHRPAFHTSPLFHDNCPFC